MYLLPSKYGIQNILIRAHDEYKIDNDAWQEEQGWSARSTLISTLKKGEQNRGEKK